MQGPTSSLAPRLVLRRRPRRLPSAVAIGAAVALGAGGAARADDPNPYYIGLSEAISHDTNINRVAGGPGDTYSSTGLIGGVDQSIGRQRVYGSGNVTLNRYRDQTELNNTSYGLNAALDWQTIGRLSGTLSARVSQSLASQTNTLLQNTSSDNLVRTQSYGARAAWGVNSAIAVQGGYGYNRATYTAPSYQANNSHDQNADIGIYYQPGTKLTLGTAVRYTRSNSEQAYLLSDGSYAENRTTGRNIDLSATWRPTPQSGANARISYTRQSNSISGGDGFSGLTGALGFSYAATGKLSLTGQLSRDAATNSNVYYTTQTNASGQTVSSSQPVLGLASNSSISTGVSLGAAYSVTAKVGLNAGLQYTRSSQDQTNINPGYSDHVTTGSLGGSWAIRRFWSAGCSATHVKRNLSGSFQSNYSATVYGCSTQVTLQ